MIIKTDNIKDEIKLTDSILIERVEVLKDFASELKDREFNILCVLSGELVTENDRIISLGELILSDKKTVLKNLSKNTPKILNITLSASGILKDNLGVYLLSRCEKEMISAVLSETDKLMSGEKTSEEMIKLIICTLLLKIKRGDIKKADAKKETDVFLGIVSYMEDNLGKKISLDDISYYAGISKTSVKKLFKEEAGFGACEYFTRLKIERAKELIADNKKNFTEIAEVLGYDSIHYFSGQFKQYVNMSPTEYLLTIKKSDIV